MASQVLPDADVLKQKGNELFAAKDYEGAIECYTKAIVIDGVDVAYPLNRSFANLKLERWAEAEQDAHLVLSLDKSNLKALHRRALARKALNNFSGARDDIFAFAEAGGDLKTVVTANELVAVAEASAVQAEYNTPACGYTIHESDAVVSAFDHDDPGLGAFATRAFRRGDLILVEKPLYKTSDSASEATITATTRCIPIADRVKIAQLENGFPDDWFHGAYYNVHRSNGYATGQGEAVLCDKASRFNHSCSPNARSTWNVPTQTMRIRAVADIAEGEEIFISYLPSRKVYGGTKAQRQALTESHRGFVCACVACTLPPNEQSASDHRRAMVARLLCLMPLFPPDRTVTRLQAVVKGVGLMAEEGYHADADDFTNYAAGSCSAHSDWASVRYWALKTYTCRVLEFGADSHRALDCDIGTLLLQPTKCEVAGLAHKQVFDVRM